MLYRKIKLSTFGLYLKAVSKLWLVPLLTVNVLVPVISAVLYKNGGAGAESDIVTVMYFLLPISTVWTSIFVSEFFFSDRTRDVLFFYSRKKRFAVSQLFFLLPLANVAAVTLLLVPSRVLACLLSRLVPLRDEEPTPEQLQKKLLPRALLYAASAAVVYLAAYPILNFVFGTGLLNLGIYLPMLVVEPLLTYRFGRVQETVHKAVSKGVRITVGYALLLLVVGIVREWLSLGTVFGAPGGRWALLPLAKMPAGGFIVLGILCAIWRAAAAKRKEYLQKEARDTLTVHYQKEVNREP